MSLWGLVELFNKRRLRSLVAGTRTRHIQDEHEARERRAGVHSPDFADALGRLAWEQIFGLPDSSRRQRLLFLKTKGLRLSGWDVANARRGCPHCAAAGSAGRSTFHIVWDCPSAKQLWGTLRSRWAALRLWTGTSFATDRDFPTAVFSLRLPRTPPQVWDMAALSQHSGTHDALEGPYPALLAHRRTLDAQPPPLHARLVTDLKEKFRSVRSQGPDGAVTLVWSATMSKAHRSTTQQPSGVRRLTPSGGLSPLAQPRGGWRQRAHPPPAPRLPASQEHSAPPAILAGTTPSGPV